MEAYENERKSGKPSGGHGVERPKEKPDEKQEKKELKPETTAAGPAVVDTGTPDINKDEDFEGDLEL